MSKTFITAIILLVLFNIPAKAEFMLSSAILEFTPDSPRQKDIEAISVSAADDYLVAEIYEIISAGSASEERVLIDDATKSGLLVTPNKTVLAGNSRKVIRFVSLKEPEDKEHIYRVVVKPVINDVEHDDKIGLKILVGYEVLVIVRPKNLNISYKAERKNNKLTVTNSGNSNILLQSGRQCSGNECKSPPVTRVYAGTTANIELPLDTPVTYFIWDGKNNTEAKF